MIDALAFLQINDVALGMAFLQQNVHPHPQAMELFNYFDSTYVNGFQRNLQLPGHPAVAQMVPPMFPPVLWNLHIATLNNDPRTNNVCESWNNAYYHIVGHHHPSMWNSVQGLQKQYAKDKALIFLIHFCPGTITTYAINSDLQRGLDRRLRHIQH